MVRGYHVYMSIWDAACDGEAFPCDREIGNGHDPSAVAVKKGGVIVGHVPRTISTVCSSFIRQGGTISATVNGTRRYSADLDEGGVEIPCILTFSSLEAFECTKTKKRIEVSLKLSVELAVNSTKVDEVADLPSVVQSIDNHICSSASLDHTQAIEIHDQSDALEPAAKKPKLDVCEIENIIMGVELSDLHINLAQGILKRQFPGLNGLISTLYQDKELKLTESDVNNKVQIIHCKQRHHWIVASTVKNTSEVIVVDSIFKSLDEETKLTIFKLFQYDCKKPPMIKVIKTQKQKGNKDCGLFAIAMATAIAFGHEPNHQKFRQELMRAHLADCLKNEQFCQFP